MFSRLLASLLGAQEIKWMQHAIDQRLIHLPLYKMALRRLLGEPLQYILGTQPFGPLNLLARPPVLIPRPETEHWVIRLAESWSPSAQKPIKLLDLCTGSGCIPLLLCHMWPPGSVHAHALDISPHALRLAKDNALLCATPSHSLDKKNLQNTLNISNGNVLADNLFDTVLRLNAPFNILTSNPPYIPWKEYQQLPRSVAKFEDPQALLGGQTGLDFYHAIARMVSRNDVLTSDGIMALEVGHDQAPTVAKLMRDTGRFCETDIWLDPWGKGRTVIARM